MQMRIIVRTAFLCSALSATAMSQVCNGFAPFSAGPVRLGAGARFGNGAKLFGGEIAFGSQKAGPFAGVSLSNISYDDFDDSAMAYGGSVGYSTPVGTAGRAGMCPMASFSMTSGPDVETGFGTGSVSGHSLGLGLGLGGVASSSSAFDLVLFASGEYIHGTSTLELAGSSNTESDDYGALVIGTGFVFNKTVTLQPNFLFPLGLEGEDPSFGLVVSFSIGRKP